MLTRRAAGRPKRGVAPGTLGRPTDAQVDRELQARDVNLSKLRAEGRGGASPTPKFLPGARAQVGLPGPELGRTPGWLWTRGVGSPK